MNRTELINGISVVIILFIFVSAMIFTFTDYQPVVGQGQSMEPVFYKHDLMIVDSKDYTVDEGDIVRFTYRDNVDVAHEVIEIRENGYITKGVNNPEADEPLITEEMITGEVVWIIPVSPSRLP